MSQEMEAAREAAWGHHLIGCTWAHRERELDIHQDGFDTGFDFGYNAAQPKPCWTPVSERLPEGVPRVLVSWLNVVEIAYCINGVWHDDDDNEMVFGRPEAWMPLPEPYCGGKIEESE